MRAAWHSSRCNFVLVDSGLARRGAVFLEIRQKCVAADYCAAVLLSPALVQHAGRHGCGCGGKGEWPDRISDVIIFVGVAHSGLMNPVIGYWTAFFSLFTAYVGLFGQAIGGRREFGGIMSKPWRMVALSLGAWATFVCRSQAELHDFDRLTILDWTCLVIIAGCLETIIVRLKRIVTALQDGTR